MARAMKIALSDPAEFARLGERGYLHSADGQVPCIEDHALNVLGLYRQLTNPKPTALPAVRAVGSASGPGPAPAPIDHLPVPWRITFDTNPDDCNFSCTMCEQHSEYSPHQKQRKAEGIKRRRMDFDFIKKTVEECAGRGLKEIVRRLSTVWSVWSVCCVCVCVCVCASVCLCVLLTGDR